MINRVTCKVVARNELMNKSGEVPLCLQVFVNGQRDLIPLRIYIKAAHYDKKERIVKSSCPEAIYYNSTIADAKNMAAAIVYDANTKRIMLDKKTFRTKLTQTVSDYDFTQFWEDELKKRQTLNDLSHGTFMQQKSSLNKLREFQRVIKFAELTPVFLQDYERWLRGIKLNNINTVSVALKNLKAYINLAQKNGHEFKSPFLNYKIKRGEGRIVYCTIDELHALLKLYDMNTLQPGLQQSLLVFLVECFTGLRISDIKRVEPNWIANNIITFIPQKTKRFNKYVNYPLPDVAARLLNDLFAIKKKAKLKSDQRINDDLKLIGAMERIAHNLSTHVGRHTFATTYLALKGTERGTVEVLRDIMGHSRVETTLRYVHVLMDQKVAQIENFNTQFQ